MEILTEPPINIAKGNVTFKGKKKDLIKIFKHLCPGRRKRYSNYRSDECEITVTDAKATFASRGKIFSIDCITKGTAKITVPVYYIYDIIDGDPSNEMKFEVTEGAMKINKVTINVTTCFFKDDRILRTIRLPMNYDEADVIRLLNDHTVEELTFNNIFNKVNLGLVRLDKNINSAYNFLKVYGVTKEEIEQLVAPKLFKDGKIPA